MTATLSYTYDELIAAIQTWVEDNSDEFVAALPQIVAKGESRLYTDLNMEIFDRTRTGSLTPDQYEQPIKPSTWQGTRSLYLTNLVESTITLLSYEEFDDSYNESENWSGAFQLDPLPAGTDRMVVVTMIIGHQSADLDLDTALAITFDELPVEHTKQYFQTDEVERIVVVVAKALGTSAIPTSHTLDVDFSNNGGQFTAPNLVVVDIGVSVYSGVQQADEDFESRIAEDLVLNEFQASRSPVLSGISSGELVYTAGLAASSLVTVTWGGGANFVVQDQNPDVALRIAHSTQESGTPDVSWDFTSSLTATAAIAVNFRPATSGGPQRTYLQRRTYEYCVDYEPNEENTATPIYYAELTETEFFMSPPPDQAYGFVMREVSQDAGLKLGPTNQNTWLGDHVGDLLLETCLIEAETYTLSDQFDVDKWKTSYSEKLPQRRIELRQQIRSDYSPMLNAARTVDNRP